MPSRSRTRSFRSSWQTGTSWRSGCRRNPTRAAREGAASAPRSAASGPGDGSSAPKACAAPCSSAKVRARFGTQWVLSFPARALFEAIVLLVEIRRDVFFLIRKVAGSELRVAIADLRHQLRRSTHSPLGAKIDAIRITAKASRVAVDASLVVERLP